jgi:heptosyltransferase-2
MVNVRTDCRRYRPDRPCEPHKASGARCDSCLEYDGTRERILIIKLGAMGDVLRTTSCLTPLKQKHPHSHVTWVTRAACAPLLSRNRLVDRTLLVDSNYIEFLLTEHFDLVLGLEADPLSAAIAGVARAAVKRGFVADGRGGVTPLDDGARQWWLMGLRDDLKRQNRRTYGEWLYQICDVPPPVARPVFELGDATRTRVSRFLRSLSPDAVRRVCFNTGAGARWREKRWNASHYVAFAKQIHGQEPRTAVILVGGPAEADLNRELITAYPRFVDAGANNSIADFAAIIAACDWLLTSDSLGYHLASAVGTPATCLVGPTSPWELDLYGINRVLYSDLECIACYRPVCPFATTCMDLLSPDAIRPHVLPHAAGEGAAAVVAVPVRGTPTQGLFGPMGNT